MFADLFRAQRYLLQEKRSMDIDLKSLHPLEVKVLRHVSGDQEFSADTLVRSLGFNTGQCNQAFSWLEAKGCIQEVRRTTKVLHELTELGKFFAERGLPSEQMFALVREKGEGEDPTLPEIADALGLEKRDVGSAFGLLSKQGVLAMNEQKQVTAASEELPEEILQARELLDKAKQGVLEEDGLTEQQLQVLRKNSKKRGASGVPFKTIEREEVAYVLTDTGRAYQQQLLSSDITGEELGQLTAEMLEKGTWKHAKFRPYQVHSPASRVILGRTNPYNAYLSWVKDKLVSLGFEEFDGPLVETEFWNGDALFMPQFHSARDIHDVYYLKHPSHAREIEQPYLDQVASSHEDGWKTGSRGWGYTFDRDFTRRQILRSQGTVMSAKTLPRAKVPGKYFGILRCFRYDQVDATHGADFYQTEGIVLGEHVNLRTLLGLLKMFAEEVAGAEEVRYVPGYFPFTEPSIEVHIKHPELGWFELGGSGIFRPEVSQALGVEVPVLAWGLGIDRMALMHLGLNDLRELFTPDIERVRLRRGN